MYLNAKYHPLTLLFALTAGVAFAQNAPVTTAATLGGVTPGSTVHVPLTVTGFSNIGAVSLTIDYNYAVMQFTGATPNPALGSFPAGDQNLGTGIHRITMGWYGMGTTLPDGSVLITLHFTFTGGITPLAWFDSGPSCEYADGNYNILNDIPTGTYYLNGSVCGAIGDPGVITGSSAVCEGQAGEEYSIAPVPNATGYAWTVPPGAVITNGQNTNLITVDYGPGAVSGDVTVQGANACGNGPAAALTVAVVPLPVANAGDGFTIPYGTSTILSAAGGGSGSYAYHWSPEELLVDPGVQNAQTVILTTTTLFTLTVTDEATGCMNSDEVTVTITGGPLAVNPVAMPGIICGGEASQLYANAGGGSGNYDYLWTSTPPGFTSTLPDPVVTPQVNTYYTLTLGDGFSTVMGATSVQVNPLPTATLTGGDTLCGEGAFDTLRVDLTGTPPWMFTYTYGSTSVFVTGVTTTPYYIIAGETGDYYISWISDAHCTGAATGTAIVRTYPIPATPEITIYYMELISSSCCGNQWYRNDTLLPGATGQTYQVYVSGSYTVVVTLNGCSSEPSEPVDMIVGIAEQGGERGISLYPNPADDQVTVQLTGLTREEVTVCIMDLSGRTVRRFKNEIVDCQLSIVNCQFIMDISDLTPGMYLVRVQGEGGMITRKIMIR